MNAGAPGVAWLYALIALAGCWVGCLLEVGKWLQVLLVMPEPYGRLPGS
jgi:hypothetical protein